MMFDRKALQSELGPGPMRFAPDPSERSIAEQIAALTAPEKACLDAIKVKWEKEHMDKPFSDLMYLRFARCSPGRKKFQQDASWKVMKKFDHRYLSLTAEAMEDQLLSKVSSHLLPRTHRTLFGGSNIVPVVTHRLAFRPCFPFQDSRPSRVVIPSFTCTPLDTFPPRRRHKKLLTIWRIV